MFSVHRSSYRYWRDEAIGETPARLLLKEKVREAFDVSEGSAGARTIAAIVSQDGTDLSRYVASNLMRELALVSCQQSKHRYKRASKEHPAAPNLLARQFTVDAPDQVW